MTTLAKSQRNDELIARTLEVTEKDILQEVDGFYYYFPQTTGMWASHHLRIIADELDRRNKDWNDYISRTLGETDV